MRIESFQPLAFLALYFLTVLAVTALLAWPAWGLSSMLGGEIEFHKLAGKTFHVVAALSLWPLARMLGPSAREVLGWNLPVRRFLRDLAAGFLLGVAILSMLTGGLLLLGVREWAGGVSGAGVVLAKAVVAGLVIGLLEETFFRGAMFRLLRRAWPAAATIGVLSLFYAGLHFLRVPALAADAVAWNSGFVLLGGAFDAFADASIIDSLLALAVAGIFLGMVRERTGNIALAAGIHAGWVAVIKLTRKLTDSVPDAELSFLAGDYDGVIGYLGAAWITVVCIVSWRYFSAGRDARAWWRAALIRTLLRLFSWLPLRLAHGLGALVGTLLSLLPGRVRDITRINIALCFPLLGHRQRLALARASLRELGKGLFEIGMLWHESPDRLLARIRQVSGREQFDAARKSGRGVIVAAPHLGAWEMVGLYCGTHYGITSLYRPPRIAPLDRYIRHARERSGAKLVPTTAAGVRQLHRALKQGGVIGVLPDQQPKRGAGEFVPFFGIPAASMSLLSRLAAHSGAAVFVVWAERLDAARGYHLHFAPAADVAQADSGASITALNRAVEAAVRRCPAQYQWSYKRFELRPEGMPPLYTPAAT